MGSIVKPLFVPNRCPLDHISHVKTLFNEAHHRSTPSLIRRRSLSALYLSAQETHRSGNDLELTLLLTVFLPPSFLVEVSP